MPQQSPVRTRTQRKLRVHKPTGEFSVRAAGSVCGERGGKESRTTNPAGEYTGEYLEEAQVDVPAVSRLAACVPVAAKV